jgi:hypothetical protein
LFFGGILNSIAIGIGPHIPIGAGLLELERHRRISPDGLKTCEFQQVGQAGGRIIKLIGAKRAHERRDSDAGQNQHHGQGDR